MPNHNPPGRHDVFCNIYARLALDRCATPFTELNRLVGGIAHSLSRLGGLIVIRELHPPSAPPDTP